MKSICAFVVLLSMVSGTVVAEDVWGDDWALGEMSPVNPKIFAEPAPRLGFIMSSGKMLTGPYKKIPEKTWILPGKEGVASCTYERNFSKDDLSLLQKKWIMCDGVYDNYYWYDCPQLKGRYKNLGYGAVVRSSAVEFKSVPFSKSEIPIAAVTDALRKRAKMPQAKVLQRVYRVQDVFFVLGALFKKNVLWISGIYQLDAQEKMMTTLSLDEWRGEDVCADCGPLMLGDSIDFLFQLSNVFVASGKWLLLTTGTQNRQFKGT